jgi:hypothetical protein
MQKRRQSELFKSLTNEFNRYLLEQKSQIARDMLVFPASEGDRLGQSLFSNLTKGGYCTLVVTGRRDWNPRSHYYEATRFAARRGCEIHRSFILPHKHLRHDTNFIEHIKLDNAAGIHTRVLYAGDLISTLALPVAESIEFGIWDDIVGCIGISGASGIAKGIEEWRLTTRSEDLQRLNDIKQIIEKKAQVVSLSNEQDSIDLEEPMITTAPIAHELAGVLCQGDHVSPEDCSWYHTIWQYLRIFNMVSTPTWHADFYLNSLQKIAENSNCHRVLVSGTADYSMMAHIIWAYTACSKEPEITVLDLCETPLFLCKWYGKSFAKRIHTASADILTYQANKPFNLIATDAFLTRFAPEGRLAVVRKWYDLLSPNGFVVTTIRIEPGSSNKQVRATPSEADIFRRRALQEARKWQSFIRCHAEQIADLAQRYAERMTSYSLGSEAEVKSLFSDAGFKIEQCNLNTVPGEMASTLYAEIVARRP